MNPKNEVEAIITLPPGTRPTEAGVYLTKFGRLVEIVDGTDGCLWALTFGQDRTRHPDSFTFIARIYPDRIGQE